VQPCAFHRKNYFYPDMPKAYQISQYDVALNVNGWLDLPDGSRVGIERAHLEEDTGKSTHTGGADGRIHGSASDAKMEEGSMRVDANVSVQPMARRIARSSVTYWRACSAVRMSGLLTISTSDEARRQIDLITAGESVRQETRHWDEGDGRTHTLRSKEEAEDYRYFLEPDLVPLVPDPEWIEAVRKALPPLPAARRAALATATGAAADSEAVGVVVDRGQDDFVLAVAAAGGSAARALVYVKEAFAEAGDRPGVPAADLAGLTTLETSGGVTATQAKAILGELVANGGGDAAAIAREKGFQAMDTSALEALVDEAIANNAAAWDNYVGGSDKAIGALVGAVMKASKGKADGGAVTAILRARRGA
jgi:aspartyl-tRNA(Asn)/glutamyl-tRNA(Gln) amidotransferase subunit B